MKTSTQFSSGGLVVATLLFTGSFLTAQSTSTNTATKKDSGSIIAAAPKAKAPQSSNTAASPLYESHGSSGQNPLYESKDKTVSKPGVGAASAQHYKTPEDMTTRYRPGNNKTTRSADDTAAQGASAAQPQAMPKKHIAGVKYEDRIADDNSGGTAGQSAQGSAQRKSGSIIIHDRQ